MRQHRRKARCRGYSLFHSLILQAPRAAPYLCGEQLVLTNIFAKRLQEHARQLGISNAEAARIGVEERWYAHYFVGRREPDLSTLKSISDALGTTLNWLLGTLESRPSDVDRAAYIDRFSNATSLMTTEELEICVLQAEAMAKRRHLILAGCCHHCQPPDWSKNAGWLFHLELHAQPA